MILSDWQSRSVADRAAAGPGERLQRRRQRRMLTAKGALFTFGLVAGLLVGFYLATDDFDLATPWPPVVAATLAILYVVALFGGASLMGRNIDEVERLRSYRSIAFAGATYLVLYPVWFLLWKGGFAEEPAHWALFLIFWASLLVSSAYYRIR